jgi:recA bacterial DNA recombination protein
MTSAVLIRSEIEARFPLAFSVRSRREVTCIPTGIAAIDTLTGGIPLNSLTEICGSQIASSGKTSVLVSLLARATQQEQFCALVDARDSFDPVSAETAGVSLSHLLWVRCGKTKQKLRPLEQAFKVADMLLQSSGFGLIAVDLSGIAERFVRNVSMSTWFRFSRVVEQQPTALVFIEQHPHATSCAGLVLRLVTESAGLSGKLLTNFNLKAEVTRTREKKGVQSATPDFSIKAQWA